MVMMDAQHEDTLMVEAVVHDDHNTAGFIDPRALQTNGDGNVFDFEADMANMSDGSEVIAVSRTSSPPPPKLRRSLLPTGCCYDERMKLHANADFSVEPAHPEDPKRIAAIMRMFTDQGLIYLGSEQKLKEILKDSPTKFMYRIAARKATEEEICTVHTADHFRWVADTALMPSDELRALSQQLDVGRRSLYLGNLTYEASLVSAGGAIETCKNVVNGTVKNAIAVIRPPGHHAESDEALGFCIFNNVPIAARVCQEDFPDICRKILILDWDVHHGNGIQNMFYEDPNVLYISLHVYDGGKFYPGPPEDPDIPDAGHENVGAGPGSGKNVNIPWDKQGMGDGEYLGAFQRIVMPIAQEFNPDLVIVSAGFDAADGDELGGCFVTPACYAHMTHMLMSLASGKIAVCLEGGYNLKAISRSALAVAQTLMGEPPPQIKMPPINSEALKVLNKVREVQAPFWECMRPATVNVKEAIQLGGVRLDSILRTAQYTKLREHYKMVDLYVLRNKIANALKHQILVTPGLPTAKKVLLIVHDPPETRATPDPANYNVEPHNVWVIDSIMPYIDWAVANGFAVIDVNMPAHIEAPDDEEEDGFIEAQNTNIALQRERMREVMCFIWDNHLETLETNDIVLMGVGNSYASFRELLLNRDAKSKIAMVLSFITGGLLPLRSETDPNLAQWYKEHSRIFVNSEHSCWNNPDDLKKVRKRRYGGVVKSPYNTLSRMLKEHVEEATDWIEANLEHEADDEED